ENGKFRAQSESDIDDLLRSLDRYEKKIAGLHDELRRSKGGAAQDIAAHMRKVAQDIVDECIQLSQMNLAFRTNAAHRQFTDRLQEYWGKAKRVQRNLAADNNERRQPAKARL